MNIRLLYPHLHCFRNITVIILLNLLIINPAQADWTLLNSGTTYALKAADFPVDDSTGYVVGSYGTILKTTNGGASWITLKSGTNRHLTDVDFVDNLTGYACGGSGTMLKTTDGGASWTRLNTGTSRNLSAVHFPVDANVGYAGGDVATLLKTTDGGQTWTPQSIVGGYVKDIEFPQDATTGYASAIWGSLGWVHKTTDGGATWIKVLDLEDASLYSISFPVNDQVGYAANHDTYYQSGMWKTSDGGASWQYISAGVTEVPYAVHFSQDTQNGIAVGTYGAILKTTDGGATWTEGNIGVNSRMEDIVMLNNSIGYAVGGQGLIYKTTDGGDPPINILYLHPTGPGSINSFTDMVGCSSDWDCVNDQPGNLGSGSPVTVYSRNYVADGSGNRAMFALDDDIITANQLVSKICVSFAATQWNGSYASPSYQRIGIDPVPVDATPFWVNYWYNNMASSCWSDLNWSAADVNALEIGVKSVDGAWLEVGQAYLKVFYSTAP